MNISENKLISLSYVLRLNGPKGEIIETIDSKNPLVFLYGSGNILPYFEEQLKNLSASDFFSFALYSDQAYGPVHNEAIVDVPLSAFEVNGKVDYEILRVGNTIPMRDHRGNAVKGNITHIGTEYITMDFNHPLAGQNLYFEGSILDVREATEEEILSHSAGQGNCGCGEDPGDCCECSNDGNEGAHASCGCNH